MRRLPIVLLGVAGAVGLAAGGAFMVLRGSGPAAAPTCARGAVIAAVPGSLAVPDRSAVPSVASSVVPGSPAGSVPSIVLDPALTAVPALVISAPRSAPAGAPLTVRLLAPAEPDGAPVRLAVLRADAPATRDATFTGGAATIVLEPALTAAAGRLSLQALGCTGTATAAVDLRPGPAVAPLTPLVGPRRLETGSDRLATAVILPLDALGNAVAEGTRIDVQVRRPDAGLEPRVVRTDGLLGVAWLTPGRVAGDTMIAASVAGVRGSSATLGETAGPPVAGFAVAIEGPATVTVGERTRRIVLRGLTDAGGNRLPDGTLVTILVTEPDATVRTEQAPLVAGGVDVVLESPAVPGLVRVQLRIDGADSAVATAWYGRSASAVPVPLTATYDPAIRAIRVAIGPIVGDLGAWAPDGSEIVLTASGAHGWVDQRVLRLTDGAVDAEIPVAEGETSVHLFVRSPFGRTEATVAIP